MSEVGNFLPIEALQYPQTYSATNQRLKRTYGIKRDRNRKTDQVPGTLYSVQYSIYKI